MKRDGVDGLLDHLNSIRPSLDQLCSVHSVSRMTAHINFDKTAAIDMRFEQAISNL